MISYSTDELLNKNLQTRLANVQAQNKPQAAPSKNGKKKGVGTKPVTPPQMKAVNSLQPQPQQAAPSMPPTSTPAPVAKASFANAGNAAKKMKKFTPENYSKKPPAFKGRRRMRPDGSTTDVKVPAPANQTAFAGRKGSNMKKNYYDEDVEKFYSGIAGTLAAGLGAGKSKVAGMLGPKNTAKVKDFGGRVKNRYTDSAGKANKRLIARDVGIGTAIGAGGYALGNMTKRDSSEHGVSDAERDKRLRDLRVGTASNLFGAGMGALATYQAADAGRRAYRKRKEAGYEPKTKAGKRVYDFLESKKGGKKLGTAMIVGGALGSVAGQALNGAMDANSARVFMNEERRLRAPKPREEGLVKSATGSVGNGTGTNLGTWYGENPHASESNTYTSVGKAYSIEHRHHTDSAVERKRKRRNQAASAVTGAGAVTGAVGAVGAYRSGAELNNKLSVSSKPNPNNTHGSSKGTPLQRGGSALSELFSPKAMGNTVDAQAARLHNKDPRLQSYKSTNDTKEQRRLWANDKKASLREIQRRIPRNLALAGLGLGAAVAGHKAKTD